jgi:hypothetical protein
MVALMISYSDLTPKLFFISFYLGFMQKLYRDL